MFPGRLVPGGMLLTVIIPAYNEEERIGPMLAEYLEYFRSQVHFLVVVNGSTDRTAAVVEQIAAHQPRLSFIDIKARIGKGGAVHEGFRRATTPLVGFVDADRATSAAEYDRLLKQLGDADGVIASRALPAAQANRTVRRRLVGRLFNLAVRVCLGLPFRDTQCGAKIFRTAAIQRVLPHLRITNLAFDVELLAFLRRQGARIREVPTVWQEVPGPAQGWQKHFVRNGLTMLSTLLDIRRRLASTRLTV